MSLAGPSITLSANSTSSAVTLQKGSNYLLASGSFGGGTLTPEISFDGGTTYAPIKLSQESFTTSLSLTSSGAVMLNLPECKVRWVLSGATSPSITCQVSAEPTTV